ncbi:MAG: hypothetical protein M3295_04670 [Chloroflexota bacterium]|nr:hypothetical protein [Chloroflexota bacterium]
MRFIGVIACAGLLLAAGCKGGGESPSVSATPAPRDYCAELGFEDGEERNAEVELIAECRLGPTPVGGAYSIARYLADGEPVDKDDATEVEITEYDADGNVITTTVGSFGQP